MGSYNVIQLSPHLKTLKNSPLLQKVSPVFRNSDPVAFLDSYLLEIKIILTHHLAQKTCLIILKILHYKPAYQNLCIS